MRAIAWGPVTPSGRGVGEEDEIDSRRHIRTTSILRAAVAYEYFLAVARNRSKGRPGTFSTASVAGQKRHRLMALPEARPGPDLNRRLLDAMRRWNGLQER